MHWRLEVEQRGRGFLPELSVKRGVDNYDDNNDDNDKKTIDGNNHLIAGELTGEMCGERTSESVVLRSYRDRPTNLPIDGHHLL